MHDLPDETGLRTTPTTGSRDALPSLGPVIADQTRLTTPAGAPAALEAAWRHRLG